METIIVFLWGTNEEEVICFLQETYTFQKGPPWIDEIDGDACLYIDFYQDLCSEFDPKEIEEIASYSSHQPSVVVSADVSGRHIDKHPERNFVRTLMTRFRAVARDDYTNHLWTLEEINSGYLVEGHTFFDYQGWYGDFKTGLREQ